ncbi:MAG: 7-cyano-7-deazaguanine synthase [Gemmataceae bacterium]
MTDAAPTPLAVLVSGGLDSAILLAEEARRRPAAFPLYVRFGLAWEDVELAHLRRFLSELRAPTVRPLTVLDMPVRDVYGDHWSVTGRGVPDEHSADEAVFLPGRNALLLVKALLWCHLHRVPDVAMAPLESNPFPDATPAFFGAFSAAVNQGVGGAVRVTLPYRGLHKTDVLRRGAGLPLEWSFSCIRPAGGRHCGRCNKCAERRKGFAEAGVPDPTHYAE